jgi:hypothetical protein
MNSMEVKKRYIASYIVGYLFASDGEIAC